MNTINGNFIEKSIPNIKNATIALNIGGVDATMNLVDFAAAINAEPVAPYKVFTGLLTQSGGDNPGIFQSLDNGDLVIGVTYEIAFYETGDDFTNIGAPTNANGVKFVATGTTAANWNGATELNYNTGAPVATVLENTIGNIGFTYNGVGFYVAVVPPISEQKQVVFSCGQSYKTVSNENYLQIGNNSIDGEIYFRTTNGLTTIDGSINDLPIEIRVYN